MNFSQELLEQIFEHDIRVDNIFYPQLICVCDSYSLPDSFDRMFDDLSDQLFDELCIEEEDEIESIHDLQDWMMDNHLEGVILQFSVPAPHDFVLDENGEFLHCACSFGYTTMRITYEQTLEEALNEAIKWQDKFFYECLKKAKVEQGA